MRNPNQLKVDIDRLRYSADMAELRKWLCKILKNLTDGSGSEEAYKRIEQLEQTLNETRVVFFADFLTNGTELQTSSPSVADSSNVYFFSNTGHFGYASLVVPSGTSYYSNFSNRTLWADDTLSPYADKLYVCKSNRRIYAYIGGELVVVGGQELTIDDELSTTSTNPVQNAVIAAAIQELQTRTQYFKGAVNNLDTLNAVSSLGAYEYIGNGWKGFVVVNFDAQSNVSQTALSSSTPSYDGNTLTWISGQPSVIRRSYVNGSWTHWEEVGVKPDAALSTTSENAVQNKAITAELNRLQEEIDSIETPTMREFDIDDETGCLMLTEVGRDDGTSFEIDEYGNFNVVVNE